MHDRIDQLKGARLHRLVGGVIALLLVAACGACAGAPAGGTAAGQPPAATPPSLQWSPKPDDVMGADLEIQEPVTLELCAPADRCRQVARYQPPRQVLSARLSSDGRYAFVWHRTSPATHLLDIHDVMKAQRVGRVELGEQAEASRGTMELRWTAGDTIMQTWGAGTFVALGRLYGVKGELLLEVDAPAIEVSPDLRYLVTYPPPGTPLAETRKVSLYDLLDGTRVAEHEGDIQAVTAISWRDGKAVISYQTKAQETGELVVP